MDKIVLKENINNGFSDIHGDFNFTANAPIFSNFNIFVFID